MKAKGKAKKIVLGVLAAYILLMLVGYLGVSFYYSNHFFRQSVINGIDSGNLTVAEVKQKIVERTGEYTLTIETRDGKTEKITADQIKLKYVDDKGVDKLMEQQENFKWIFSFARSNNYKMTADTSFDKTTIDGIMDKLSVFQKENIVKPVNAYIKETDTGFEIAPEVLGNELNRKKTKEVLIKALESGKTRISLDKEKCYNKPTVLSTDKKLKKEVDSLNKMTAAAITYTFGSRSEVVDRSQIKEWLVKGEDGTYSLDSNQVAAYVKHMAYKYDTFGLEHTFTKHDGSTITLAAGGDYGWVINKPATTEALVQAINEGLVESREPIYLYTAMSREENDIGNTYVEISLSEQRMWVFKNGELIVDTAVVTGDPTKGNATPSGSVWAIDAKKQDAILKGEGYASPVTYWLPFNGNVGIHDADRWRPEYGGEIYKGNGSHGCINTPYAQAEKIFNAVEIGTPVIVYD